MNTTEIRHNPEQPSGSRAGTSRKNKLVSSKTPMTDLMLHPEKVEAVLEATTSRKSAPAARKQKSSAKAAAKSARPADTSDPHGTPSKKTKFIFKAARAGSVKLAGDFTDWDKFPIEMKPSENGDWSAILSLEPGQYAYRFIVDGQWQDDPHCIRKMSNPFGTQNAVVEIT